MFSKKITLGLTCVASIFLSVVAIEENLNEDYRADVIKNAFKHAWQGYSTFAYGHDELRPMTNGTTDSR